MVYSIWYMVYDRFIKTSSKGIWYIVGIWYIEMVYLVDGISRQGSCKP